MKKAISLLLSLVIALCCITPAFAEDKACSLTISYKDGEVPITGADIGIYKVALMTDGQYTLTGEFASDPVKVDLSSDSASAAAALALGSYASAGNRTPAAASETDEEGYAYFGNLEEGLYLVKVGGVTAGENYYSSSCYFVALPGTDAATGETAYSVISCPKAEIVTQEKTDIHVLKKWNDGKETHDPITVTLYQDGVIYGNATLSEDSSWRFTWEGLEAAHEYTIVEDEVSKYYNVSVSREDDTFVITNSLDSSTVPVNPGDSGSGETPSVVTTVVPVAVVTTVVVTGVVVGTITTVVPIIIGASVIAGIIAVPVAIIVIRHYKQAHGSDNDNPDNPDSEDTSDTGTTQAEDTYGKTDEKLPYTGVLWWPVPVMALAGISLIYAGTRLKRKKDEEAE